MDKENQAKSFWKTRGIYIVLLVASLIIITVAIVLAATSVGSTTTLEKNSASQSASYSSSQSTRPSSSSAKPSASEQPSASDEPQSSDEPQPTVKEISFIMPVENGTCIKEFTEASVVYNKTLGVYTGHMGMDITGEEGAKVFCVYEGEVTAIESSYLYGTTVTVTHENGLKTIYNSIDVDENIAVGDRLEQGDVIGYISTNNRQEYKDGAHLHFEVEENGVKVAPSKYFLGYEK